MTSAESRALARAALLVLVLCVVRALAAHRTSGDSARYGASPVGTLLAESEDRRSEDARRSRPISAAEPLDPNSASEEELDRLPGVGPATARRIVRVRDETGRFSGPEDLLAVPGIGQATLARIGPFLTWPDGSGGPVRPRVVRPERGAGRPSQTQRVLDLNRASQEDLEGLPGVGSTLAARILALRDTLGGFRTADDLERVRGLGPATVTRLKPFVIAGH